MKQVKTLVGKVPYNIEGDKPLGDLNIIVGKYRQVKLQNPSSTTVYQNDSMFGPEKAIDGNPETNFVLDILSSVGHWSA